MTYERELPRKTPPIADIWLVQDSCLSMNEKTSAPVMHKHRITSFSIATFVSKIFEPQDQTDGDV